MNSYVKEEKIRRELFDAVFKTVKYFLQILAKKRNESFY